jgi:hypothetical protein
MALNFPDNPDTNEYFTDNTSGFTYQWNGIVWISVASTQTTLLKEFDDISGSFNSSTTTFSLTFANGSTKVYPLSANQITIVIGGILQNAGDDFTISGDQITFTTAPDAGLTFQGMFYGSSVSMNSVAAGSITTSSLSTGGPIWNVGGDVTVAGIVTVGSSSVVIDGPSNEIRVGTGATINESGIIIGSGNPGIVTATEFHGDGLNLTGIVAGIGTTGSINTSGIITASSFTGSGIGLTNIGRQMHAILYSPGIAATGVGKTSNIVITFNKPINPNTGTITLKEGAADGSTVESFDVFSDRITISGGQLTIDPTSNFGAGTSYYVAMPAGAYKDILDTSSSPGISTYSFQTTPATSSLWSWGNGSLGKLGLGDAINRSSPTQVEGLQWENIEYGDHSAYAITTDGRFFAWGLNYGDLGLGDGIPRSSPTQIPGNQWSYSAHGNALGFAIKTDGTLWAIGGRNDIGGGLGLNDQVDRSAPVQIGSDSTWSKVAGGYHSAFAIKTDGSLWSWGYNRDGELLQNDTMSRSSPTQVGLETTWSSAMTHTAMGARLLKTDGTLWCAGYNYYGSLGLNDRIEYSSPRQVGSDTTWNKLGEGEANVSYAIKTDGTLWAWGIGNYGDLGQNDVVNYSSPVQIGLDSTWNQVSFSVATKTDGSLWGWGDNATGKLLQNDLIPRSSPVQIGSDTTWTGDIQAYYTVYAIKGSS